MNEEGGEKKKERKSNGWMVWMNVYRVKWGGHGWILKG
jgi:hypothetical protein